MTKHRAPFARVLGLFLFMTLGAPAARATIYLIDADPRTKSVGMVTISSGPVATYSPPAMSGVKDVGFVGWSGLASNVSPKVDAKVFAMMRDGRPPEQIEQYVDSVIHDWYSRYLFISVRGTSGYVFPPRGCAQPECGVLVDPSKEFTFMGGGLQPNVVPRSAEAYRPIHADPKLPLECKLLFGVQTIIDAGGEVSEFAEAKLGVDRPDRKEQEIFVSTVGEKGVIADLRAKIAQAGVECPTLRSRFRDVPKRPKRKRHPRSRDL